LNIVGEILLNKQSNPADLGMVAYENKRVVSHSAGLREEETIFVFSANPGALPYLH
jgi:hypothetical protein